MSSARLPVGCGAGYALRLDGERLPALWVLPFQLIVYRQLMYLVTIQSIIAALLGTRQRWQATQRTGVFADPRARDQRAATTSDPPTVTPGSWTP
jgi:hypothetical protein